MFGIVQTSSCRLGIAAINPPASREVQWFLRLIIPGLGSGICQPPALHAISECFCSTTLTVVTVISVAIAS
jgi:hypothetical protein